MAEVALTVSLVEADSWDAVSLKNVAFDSLMMVFCFIYKVSRAAPPMLFLFSLHMCALCRFCQEGAGSQGPVPHTPEVLGSASGTFPVFLPSEAPKDWLLAPTHTSSHICACWEGLGKTLALPPEPAQGIDPGR